LPIIIASTLLSVPFSAAQFPPPVTYDTVLKSPINPNVTISYKTPEPGTCVTAFPHQKQYTGYVNLPPFTLTPYQQNYSINTFFWFVEARTSPETAPLTIWLNGGPGSSSMLGLFTETGPCEVIQLQDGSYGTQPRVWGWDRSSNILFIDQPTQTGFSYDDLVNGSLRLIDGQTVQPPRPVPYAMPPWMLLNGTFATGHAYSTQNTSMIAASASWHFLQAFLSAFPRYNPGAHSNSNRTETTGINLFAESYGGIYAPAFADFYEEQNVRRSSGLLPLNTTLVIKLASVGIINGLVDLDIQAPWHAKFAHENNYGIQAIDQTTALNSLSDFNEHCHNHIATCREGIRTTDPSGEGDEVATNTKCSAAELKCFELLYTALSTGRSAYDIRAEKPDSHPSNALLEYLNTASVQQSIGAKVNFTLHNARVFKAFFQSKFSYAGPWRYHILIHSAGDKVRGTHLQSLADLAEKGVRVALAYGDA
jgi:carboxypeptidase C (cathepsin A)